MKTLEWAGACLVTVLCLALAATATYWLTADASAPVEITGPTRITDVVGADRVAFRPGELMRVARVFCRWRYEDGGIQARWENGVIYTVPSTPTRGDLGCKTRVYVVPVPHIPPGHYTYRVTAQYRNNPLVTTRVEFPPVKITVLP